MASRRTPAPWGGPGMLNVRVGRLAATARPSVRPGAGAALAVGLALAALHAPAARAGDVGGAAGISSQLVDRGIALTRDTPTLQGALFWLPAPGWSLSGSASVALDAPGKVLMSSVGLSRSWTLSDSWQLQAEALLYRYPGARANRLFNRDEVSLGWSYRDRLSLSVAAFRLPDSRLRQRWYGALDVTAHQPLAGPLSLSAGVGISEAPQALYGLPYATHHYRYGHAGLIWNAGRWSVEVDRVFSNARSGYADRGLWPWVASVSRSF
ncbi:MULTISPECIES: hypothetical protein [unclassified Xanthomonas]|uniref:hypothetical protein n=1 Tax=Xanthomonas sp. LMG 8992 TaxID=1591157 RepID=UPI00183825A1